MQLSNIDNQIKEFLYEIYRYGGQIFKLTAYYEGILTFTQLTPSPLHSMIMEVAIYDKILNEFIWLVPYKIPLIDIEL